MIDWCSSWCNLQLATRSLRIVNCEVVGVEKKFCWWRVAGRWLHAPPQFFVSGFTSKLPLMRPTETLNFCPHKNAGEEGEPPSTIMM